MKSLLPLLTLVFASLANAQLTRTWVSGVGDDKNPCSRTAACKTFQVALGNTAAGGEINCLDPGEFGQVIINKAITIDCGGTFGSILATARAIHIFANAASDVVNIRNLSIDGPGMGSDIGILYSVAKAVHIENIKVSGASYCVEVASANPSQLTIENSTLNCVSAGVYVFSNSADTVTVDIHNTRITNCFLGIQAENGARVDVRDSVISMSFVGIIQVQHGAGSTVLVTGSTLALNVIALQSSSGAFLGASDNTFSNNTMTVYNQNGGEIYTGNDNALFGNAATGATSGVLPKN